MSDFKLNGEAAEFISVQRTRSTAKIYRRGLTLFQQYYTEKHGPEATLSTFLDRLDKNLRLPRRERQRLAETEFNGYIDLLKGKGLSNKSIRAYFTAVQGFLKYKGFQVSGRYTHLPPATPVKENHKHPWKIDHLREFLGWATSMRDKAIILCLFQSGLSVSDLCHLDYGDVVDELHDQRLPLILHLYRQKTGQEFKTFFGRDAVKYLRLYLENRSGIKRKDPLFTALGSEDRMSEGAIQKRFRKISMKVSFLKEHDLEGYTPTRAHSLRSAFRSRLTGKTDPDLIEFFMGHSIGEVKRAYINLPVDELREIYSSLEHLLSVEKTSRDEKIEIQGSSGELEKRIKFLESEVKELRSIIKTDQKIMERLSSERRVNSDRNRNKPENQS